MINIVVIFHWVFGAFIIGYYVFWLMQQLAHHLGFMDAETENAAIHGVIKILSPAMAISWLIVLGTGIARVVNYYGWNWIMILAAISTGCAILVGIVRIMPLGKKIEKLTKKEIKDPTPKEYGLFNQMKRLEVINSVFVGFSVAMMIVSVLT